MNDKLTIQDLIEKIAERNKVTKKLSEDWLRLLPETIEEGLIADGFVKVRGLGTFRLKWVEKRIARNLRTGEEVEVPAHSRVIFQAEKKVKELINEDYKYLSYSVIDEGEKASPKPVEKPVPEPEPLVETAPSKPDSKQDAPEPAETPPPVPPGKKPKPARRKYLWVIPLTFLVIIILAILFYLRNCTRNAEYAKPMVQKEQVIAPAEQQEEAAAIGQPPADSLQETGKEVQHESTVQPAAEEPDRRAELQTPEKVIVTSGEWLFQLAREHYGNPFLWVLIYQANSDQINDPDNLAKGITITIPGLEGTPRNLSRQDSSHIADGYRLIYEYYSSRGDQRADGFYQEVMKYNPR